MKFHIETERLILREFRETDAEDLFRMDSLAEVHRYLGNKPITHMDEAKQVIAFVKKQYVENGIGRWATIEKISGNFIGWSGLKFITEPENNQVNFYDVGYRLHPDYWGKGYATESGKAALKYGFEVLNAKEIIGTCHEENIASRRALEKCGLRFIEKFMYDSKLPCDWLKITKSEWEQYQIQ
jgi:ribosomal-protein-alanine N-acetyltransferase